MHQNSKVQAKKEQPSATINDLPSEILKNIFSYVGRGNYALVGPVSKDFCYNYLTMDVIEDKLAHKMDVQLAIQRNSGTTIEAASSSKALAEYCFLHDAPPEFLNQMSLKAIAEGNRDVVKVALAMGFDITQGLKYVPVTETVQGELIQQLCVKGDLEMMKLLGDLCIMHFEELIIDTAAYYGHLEMLKWIQGWIQHEYRAIGKTLWTHKDMFFASAARGGRLEIIKWGKDEAFLELNKTECIKHAAESGQLELVKWFHRSTDTLDTPLDLFTFENAVSSGNVALIKYLLENDCPHDSPEACTFVCNIQDHQKAVEILELLHQYDVPWNESTCACAAANGNLTALIYARSNGCAWDEETLIHAVQSNHLNIVEYCLRNGCPRGSADICMFAMFIHDHDQALKCLQTLREFAIPWSAQICAEAANSGNIKALKWAKSEGCSWNEDTFCNAVGGSCDIEIVNYCIENNCPFNDEVYMNAISSSDPITFVNCLRDNGYPWSASVCADAAYQKDLKLLRWLRYNNCPWDENVCHAAVRNNDLLMLKYAHENKCPWTKETYAYCFNPDEGLQAFFRTIPSDSEARFPIILNYLQLYNCPKPDDSEWNVSFRVVHREVQ
ncbi:hypothetical protein CTEN210_09857 [Chaetoceros tenuissimus]|uniref:F-box domain-containing protein n=1 Tax=Chaetoceros tenuissimus TaxID=426638 RepID=A0AAD3CW95_9STRA|nr:hypothetical protein CTEN210_09857 [Chaetoceros tenuissimus]